MPPSVVLMTGVLPELARDGIGDYTAHLARGVMRTPGTGLACVPFGQGAWRKAAPILRSAKLVHVEYPSWHGDTRQVLVPLMLRRYCRKARIMATFHEWNDLRPIVRCLMLPLVLQADPIVFVSKTTERAFLRTRWAKGKTTHFIPIGTNIVAPDLPAAELERTRTEEVLRGEPWEKVIAHFGFIYAGKQPELMLKALAVLKQRGRRVKLLFVGDVYDHRPKERDVLLHTARQLGVDDRIEITGFLPDSDRAAKLVAACDAVIALYGDGLSMRRGSYWFTCQLGNPVVCTEPTEPDEFAGYEQGVSKPHITTVPLHATPEHVADALMLQPEWRPGRFVRVHAPAWADIAARHVAVYRSLGALRQD